MEKPEETKWQGYYFASAPGQRPLHGEDSWSSGTYLRDGLAEAFSRVSWAFVREIGGKTAEGQKVKISGLFALFDSELKGLPGVILAEEDRYTVVRIPIFFAGVRPGTHVFERGEVAITPSEVKDSHQ